MEDKTAMPMTKFNRIINSLLENDMYKFSMGQAIFLLFPDYMTRWAFKCRNKKVVFTHEMIEEIRQQVMAYCTLRFNENELEYLGGIRWIKPAYINFLRLWKPRIEDISIRETDEGCHLEVETYGTWLNTSMYEIPLLAIINEVYYRFKYDYGTLLASFRDRASAKVEGIVNGDFRLGNFSEFGERRRLSSEAQEYIIGLLVDRRGRFPQTSNFVGTSNVYLARKFGITPVGTMAHEFIQCVGQGNHKHNPAYSNYYMMKAWTSVYGVDNGIALTDCITTDAFLRDFDRTYATLFNGVRHDSGDPGEWGWKMIFHFKSFGINPHTKTLLFSDSLNFKKATELYDTFSLHANVAFGIGTFLSNDTEAEPLNIVCKVVECNGMPVAKLSDVSGKRICQDEEYIAYLERTIRWRLTHND